MHKTKRAIFEKAMQLFADKGYNDTSIEEITAVAGIAKGTFYYHFSSIIIEIVIEISVFFTHPIQRRLLKIVIGSQPHPKIRWYQRSLG